MDRGLDRRALSGASVVHRYLRCCSYFLLLSTRPARGVVIAGMQQQQQQLRLFPTAQLASGTMPATAKHSHPAKLETKHFQQQQQRQTQRQQQQQQQQQQQHHMIRSASLVAASSKVLPLAGGWEK
ncbi:unnamed protein product [Polarella glacialis]|uniref:Uncharacterized protein n=1 Tax=Polarella glacialis TaxID=89957 RepID=A0A813I997_POLGL|nr:unnamed protein product [Polarella glacialis]